MQPCNSGLHTGLQTSHLECKEGLLHFVLSVLADKYSIRFFPSSEEYCSSTVTKDENLMFYENETD